MEEYFKPKINSRFKIRQDIEEWIGFFETKGVLTFNEVGAFIVEQMRGDKTVKQIGKMVKISFPDVKESINDFPIILPKFYKQLYQESKSKKNFKIGLKKELNKIYDKEIYNKKIKVVKNEWEKIEVRFFNALEKYNLKIENKYFCYISLYGPEGQFKHPNIVDLRVNRKLDIERANETIAHEIIHLIILKKVEKLKLDYKQTEGVVDLFFLKS